MIQTLYTLLLVLSMTIAITATTQRGLYVSIYASSVGSVSFTGNLSDYALILGNTTKETSLINYLVANSFTSISLYNLNTIFANTMQTALSSFMTRVRAAGITRIEAIGGSAYTDYTNIISFHQTYQKFDGVTTEVEFWNGDGTVQNIVNATATVRAANMKDPSGNNVTVTVYIGYPAQSDVNTLVNAGIDRFYVHAYTTYGALTYNYASARLDLIKNANQNYSKSVAIGGLFSAEGSQYNAGGTPFMGDWLKANGFQQAETSWQSLWNSNSRMAPPQIGFQYYEYFFARVYSNITTPAINSTNTTNTTNTTTTTNTTNTTTSATNSKANAIDNSKYIIGTVTDTTSQITESTSKLGTDQIVGIIMGAIILTSIAGCLAIKFIAARRKSSSNQVRPIVPEAVKIP